MKSHTGLTLHTGNLLSGSALAAALLLSSCSKELPKREPTHVILISVDTLRGDAIADAQGRVHTPRLAELAADGVVFPQTFSHASLTRPSHLALMSARLPSQAGVVSNHDPVGDEVPLLAPWLSERGYYTTSAISLTAVCGNSSKLGTGLARGFEEQICSPTALQWADKTSRHFDGLLDALPPEQDLFLFAHFADPHYPYRAFDLDPLPVTIHINGVEQAPLSARQPEYVSIPLQVPKVGLEISFKAEDPFEVISLHGFAGGKPLKIEFTRGELHRMEKEITALLKPKRAGRGYITVACYDRPDYDESRRRYAQEVEHVDNYLGRLFDQLRERGIYDEALIVFTSDHGEALGEHDILQHADYIYDENIHVPLIIKPPKGWDAERERLEANASKLVSHMDIVPTILDMLQLEPLPGQRGKSLLRKQDALHFAEGRVPYAKQDQLALRDEHYKIIYHPGDGSFEFYDLDRDPEELESVPDKANEVRPQWKAMLQALESTLDVSIGSLEDIDPGLEAQLKSLGYLGEDE